MEELKLKKIPRGHPRYSEPTQFCSSERRQHRWTPWTQSRGEGRTLWRVLYPVLDTGLCGTPGVSTLVTLWHCDTVTYLNRAVWFCGLYSGQEILQLCWRKTVLWVAANGKIKKRKLKKLEDSQQLIKFSFFSLPVTKQPSCHADTWMNEIDQAQDGQEKTLIRNI